MIEVSKSLVNTQRLEVAKIAKNQPAARSIRNEDRTLRWDVVRLALNDIAQIVEGLSLVVKKRINPRHLPLYFFNETYH